MKGLPVMFMKLSEIQNCLAQIHLYAVMFNKIKLLISLKGRVMNQRITQGLGAKVPVARIAFAIVLAALAAATFSARPLAAADGDYHRNPAAGCPRLVHAADGGGVKLPG